MMQFDMYIPTKVLFGKGKLKELHKEVLPGKKALIVISKGQSTRRFGYLDSVINELDLSNIDYVIYDGIEANPTSQDIDDGANFAKDKCVDFVVAIGGGSVIDSAKMISLLITNDGSAWDYTCLDCEKKVAKFTPLPLVVISTTAGTGSEIDCASAFTYLPTSEKVAFKDERLFPQITIIDPTMTYSIPSTLTAYQGWDALTHSMENLINKNTHELGEILARKVVKEAGIYLEKAVNNGQNEKARETMALCSFLSGIVIHTSGTSSMHALECAMSALHPNLAHGAGLIILSEAYFQYFIDLHVCDEIFVEMAHLLGNVNANNPNDFIKEIKRIHLKCHADELKMSDYGITRDEFPLIVEKARKSMKSNFLNDRYMLSNDDCLIILEKSYR